MINQRALVSKSNRAQFHCRGYWLAICLGVSLPFMAQALAPVVDDSDNFAIIEDERAAYESPSSHKYAWNRQQESTSWQASHQDDETPLAMDDGNKDITADPDQKLAEQVQNLQKELQELRGQLEVQNHELKQLKEQQLTFYKDLDARLAAAGNNKTASLAPKIAAPAAKPVLPAAPAMMPSAKAPAPAKVAIVPTGIPGKQAAWQKTANNDAQQKDKYQAAYALIQEKRHQEALAAMQAFLVQYPQGAYSANAHYWLGELYMVKNNYPRAIEQFVIVLDQFPQSDKLAASTLKLGYALAASGRTIEARQRLQQVIDHYPGTTVAQLATDKLHAM